MFSGLIEGMLVLRRSSIRFRARAQYFWPFTWLLAFFQRFRPFWGSERLGSCFFTDSNNISMTSNVSVTIRREIMQGLLSFKNKELILIVLGRFVVGSVWGYWDCGLSLENWYYVRLIWSVIWKQPVHYIFVGFRLVLVFLVFMRCAWHCSVFSISVHSLTSPFWAFMSTVRRNSRRSRPATIPFRIFWTFRMPFQCLCWVKLCSKVMCTFV